MECLEKVYLDSMSSQELVSCHLSERRCKNSSRSTESIVCHISSRRRMPMLQLLKLQQMKKRVWLALQLLALHQVLQQAPPGQVQHLLKTRRKKPKRKRKQKRKKKLLRMIRTRKKKLKRKWILMRKKRWNPMTKKNLQRKKMKRKIKRKMMRLRRPQTKIRRKTPKKLKKKRKMRTRKPRKMEKRKKLKRRKRRKKRRTKRKSSCLTSQMEDLQNFTLCGRMKKRRQCQAENLKSGIEDMTTGYLPVLCATDMAGGKTFRTIHDSPSSTNPSRWTWARATSLKSRTSSLLEGSSCWSRRL